MPENQFPHIHIKGPTELLPFVSISQRGGEKMIPPRNRQIHGEFLKKRLKEAWEEAENEFVVMHTERSGVYLEFCSSPGFELIVKSLEDMRSQKIRLCNVRTEIQKVINPENGVKEEKKMTLATVFVSNDKRKHFFKKIEEYLNKESTSGKPKNEDLINGINDLRKALLIDSFWQDEKNLIPDKDAEWCEVWLRGDSIGVMERFETLLSTQNINSKSGHISFPERFIKLVHVSRLQLETLTQFSDDIAEYRRAKETASFILDMPVREQAEWVENLVDRLKIDRESLISVCILDTGINNGHSLIAPLLDSVDCHSANPIWGSDDHQGHGTLMAGLAAYGDLKKCLEGSSIIEINHILESVKILPRSGKSDPELWGDITAQGISKAEIQAPLRKRIICMAISSDDTRDKGRPSSWSGAIDQITSGINGDEKKLVIIGVGNITDVNQIANYPDALISDSIHDPAQSWNALSVGAYTQLTDLTDLSLKGYKSLAKTNEISPFTTTSLTWEDKWPIKPEVVFEGGNIAVDKLGSWTECEDLSLISTYYQPQKRLLEAFNMTSAATAQAAHFAAQIQIQYPDYWPETIRALIVHSANWPDELKKQFATDVSKAEIKRVLRICGYGVPNLEKALYCASNSLTLIAEAEIQPYEISINNKIKKYKTKDMHLYELPWPKDVLENLGEAPVEMRITLSYFIEPGPGEIGWKDRYRYASHGLRFDLNSPSESYDEFVRRINVAARSEEDGHPGTSSPSKHWVIGKARERGSVHSDIWKGTAADLAGSNLVAVFPRIGWWRERKHLGKCESTTRYSLVISIHTHKQDIDIYTPVMQQIALKVPISL